MRTQTTQGAAAELLAIAQDIATVTGARAAASRDDLRDTDSRARIVIGDYTNAVRTRVVSHLQYDNLTGYPRMVALCDEACAALQAGDWRTHASALETLDGLVRALVLGGEER
jgi:hypothetical protein